MDHEVWKDIDGFPGYQISSMGRVRSFRDFRGNVTGKSHILKLELNKDDYFQICLYTENGKKVHRRIHRLVADAFLGPQPTLVVNHIDGDKHNNRLENIEWVTAEQNSSLAAAAGLYKTSPVKIIETGEIFNSVKECAEAIKTHPSDICHAMSGIKNGVKGLHFEYTEKKSEKVKQFLYDYQMDAVGRMRNGCILNGGVGSGKSRTGLYYYFSEQGGSIIDRKYVSMKNPKDLYIITTAKKRDSLEWVGELAHFHMSPDPDANEYTNKIVIDSWNNIQKYVNIKGAFFIFDEDRVTGSGAWVKAFLKIVKLNDWIILSATSGDCWADYIPVFIANGFYKNKTEFTREHIVYSRYTNFPKIDRYLNTGKLLRLRDSLLIDMDFERKTIPHHEDIYVNYDIMLYKSMMRNRWDIWREEPFKSANELCYGLRKLVNSDESRQVAVMEIAEKHPRLIIFYNFDYERDILKNLYYGEDVEIAEWSGHAHQPVPTSKKWIYLTQYTAGCEGWNCIDTDAIVFYSQNYSYKVMTQASGRIDRLNTPYIDLYYYHLKSRSGIDLAISRALKDKKKFNERKFTNWDA